MTWLLEPQARRTERDGSWGDPDAAPLEAEIELSKAISAKRSAAALERVADALELENALQMVIHDDEVGGEQNAFALAESVCTAIARRLK